MICCPGQIQLFRRHLARIFFPSKSSVICRIFFPQITHTSPPKSNGRPLKPCLPWINCIRQPEIERIWFSVRSILVSWTVRKKPSNGKDVRKNVNKSYLSFIGRRWFRLILQETQRKPSLANGTVVTRSHSPFGTSKHSMESRTLSPL